MNEKKNRIYIHNFGLTIKNQSNIAGSDDLPKVNPSMNRCQWTLTHSSARIVEQNGRSEWKPTQSLRPRKAKKLQHMVKWYIKRNHFNKRKMHMWRCKLTWLSCHTTYLLNRRYRALLWCMDYDYNRTSNAHHTTQDP